MPARLENLTGGEGRELSIPASTSSLGNVLRRLDDRIQTEDGSWMSMFLPLEVWRFSRGLKLPM